jgi:hypothetical protein
MQCERGNEKFLINPNQDCGSVMLLYLSLYLVGRREITVFRKLPIARKKTAKKIK